MNLWLQLLVKKILIWKIQFKAGSNKIREDSIFRPEV